MSQKYTDARYPEKINDLIDNDGNVNPEAVATGTKFYKHHVKILFNEWWEEIFIITTNPDAITKESFEDRCNACIDIGLIKMCIPGNGYSISGYPFLGRVTISGDVITVWNTSCEKLEEANMETTEYEITDEVTLL